MSTATQLPKSFEELIATADKPVLVDFFADWCGPCKMLTPIVSQLARAYKGRLLTIKIDIDRKQDIAARYGVSAVPTLMLFVRGAPVETIMGVRGFDDLARIIRGHLTPTQ